MRLIAAERRGPTLPTKKLPLFCAGQLASASGLTRSDNLGLLAQRTTTNPKRCCQNLGRLPSKPGSFLVISGGFVLTNPGGLAVLISPELKDRIREANDLIAVAGEHLELRPDGRHFKALCPWHPDRNPSLKFYPDRQTYRCWVCQEGGDVFSFIEKYTGVSFFEAVRFLAQRAGIPWAESADPQTAAQQAAWAQQKIQLFEAMAWAVQAMHQCLLEGPTGEAAREYLHRRAVSEASIERFCLGYCPDQRGWLSRQVGAERFPASVLEKLGLLVRQQRGGYFERFQGRVIFPIYNLQAKPIALGGRILPGREGRTPAKYINSPESPLYSKSRELYGLHLARQAIRQTRTAVVVEGYTDCLAAHQADVEHVVAVLGTSLTRDHLHKLRRFAERVVLVLDGDEAGQRRSDDLLTLFVEEQMDLRVLTLPEGMDPCDYLQEHGADAFRQQLQRAPDALDHLFQKATHHVNPRTDTYEVTAALHRILSVLARGPLLTERTTPQQQTKRDQIIARLAEHFLLPEDDIRLQLADLRKRLRKTTQRRRTPPETGQPTARQSAIGPSKTNSSIAPQAPGHSVGESTASGWPTNLPNEERDDSPIRITPAWEQELVELVLLRPEVLPQILQQIGVDELTDPFLRAIYQGMADLAEAEGVWTFPTLMSQFDDPELKQAMVALDEASQSKADLDFDARLRGALQRAALLRQEQHRRRVRAKLEKLDQDTQVAMLEKLKQEKLAGKRAGTSE